MEQGSDDREVSVIDVVSGEDTDRLELLEAAVERERCDSLEHALLLSYVVNTRRKTKRCQMDASLQNPV